MLHFKGSEKLVLFKYDELFALKIGSFDFLSTPDRLYSLDNPAIPTISANKISSHFDNIILISIHLNHLIIAN